MAGCDTPARRECRGWSPRHSIACHIRAGTSGGCTVSPQSRRRHQPCRQHRPNSVASRGRRRTFEDGHVTSRAWCQRECPGYETADSVAIWGTGGTYGDDTLAASTRFRCSSLGRGWGDFVASRGVARSFGDGHATSRTWRQRQYTYHATCDPVAPRSVGRVSRPNALATPAQCRCPIPEQGWRHPVASRGEGRSSGDSRATSRTWCRPEYTEYKTADPAALGSAEMAPGDNALVASAQRRC